MLSSSKRRLRADAAADEEAMRRGCVGRDRPSVDKSVDNSKPADFKTRRTEDDVMNDFLDEDTPLPKRGKVIAQSMDPNSGSSGLNEPPAAGLEGGCKTNKDEISPERSEAKRKEYQHITAEDMERNMKRLKAEGKLDVSEVEILHVAKWYGEICGVVQKTLADNAELDFSLEAGQWAMDDVTGVRLPI